MSWSGHYCMWLFDDGRPCNRRTMKLGMCDEHRDAPQQKRDPEAQRVAQVRFRAKRRRERASAGLGAAMEVA
jgi:hypothetical protein